jgi:hypothetical protein
VSDPPSATAPCRCCALVPGTGSRPSRRVDLAGRLDPAAATSLADPIAAETSRLRQRDGAPGPSSTTVVHYHDIRNNSYFRYFYREIYLTFLVR